MAKIKIAFFDIDGTLVDLDKDDISAQILKTLNQLKTNGIITCVASGRAPLALPSFLGFIFDAYITFNGSYCYTSDQLISSNPIPQKDVLQIVKNASSINRPVCIATKNCLAANGADQDLIDYFKFGGLKVNVSPQFNQIINEPIYQIMMGARQVEYPKVMQDVHGAKITAWWDRAVDIIPANGGKGIAIEQILKYYKLSPSEAIAFGDGNNDIPMLKTVGTGVAMANGSPELKALATEVCPSVGEDGIYHYCKEHDLI
ncbi:Cof-type HAD-IIB family hydrolase [Lactobacillus ultunensis]|uniref:Cof-like hydrolase n=1 Tax=Lactobacillus ultunensis DSM 16047 TaxID=525365 RepID=C2ELQ1_9LACO|nr:Cof-type HAD-IIB family hydrolase [Lactobacillus ultunensis]EEJ72546.1 Cof-like hydrolase [Lactobacillus ultunensis DSM 16047]KRL80557.1 HAD hydrolase [Lactobacillus ultunensis DSM 16047]QQP28120.1 Cof-type HAD-IIB family hydrolase [Lactobacillus ultunensis]